MKLESRMAYLEAVVTRYLQAAKALKTRILDELCKVCAYNRKYVIWKLNRWSESKEVKVRRVRRRGRRSLTVFLGSGRCGIVFYRAFCYFFYVLREGDRNDSVT